MIYTVKFDGIDIYGEDLRLTLLSPTVVTELNTAGSFEFTMPPEHSFYNVPKLLTSDVEVFEDGESIWFGRPMDITTDFYNQKKVRCEGILACLNDSIQRPGTYEDVLLAEVFRELIARHNTQVAANRRFTVGRVTVPDRYVNCTLNYETTLEAVRNLCLNNAGGYFFTRRENGVNRIDWLSDMPYTGDQPVQFALNVLDLTQNMSGLDIKTAVIPLGAEINGQRLTVSDVNSGFDYIESDAAAEFGRITQVVEFSGVTDAAKLLEAGYEWLSERQFDPLTIEVDAAELRYLDNRYSSFQVGQTIHCTSTPHLLDRKFPLTRISLGLDTAVKRITIGTAAKRQLSEIYHK